METNIVIFAAGIIFGVPLGIILFYLYLSWLGSDDWRLFNFLVSTFRTYPRLRTLSLSALKQLRDDMELREDM